MSEFPASQGKLEVVVFEPICWQIHEITHCVKKTEKTKKTQQLAQWLPRMPVRALPNQGTVQWGGPTAPP